MSKVIKHATEKLLTNKDKLLQKGGGNGKKKNEEAKKDSVASIRKYEESIERSKRKIEDMEKAVVADASEVVDSLKKSDVYETLSYLGKRKAVNDTSCLICATDFSLLVLHNDPSMFTTIGHKCMRCAAYCCYKCVYQQTTTNNHCENSIGYECGACKFYNFGKTMPVKRPRVYEPSTVTHPASGFSTLNKAQIKGEPLPTSGTSLQKYDHEENLLFQRAFIEARTMEREGDVSEENYRVVVSLSPPPHRRGPVTLPSPPPTRYVPIRVESSSESSSDDIDFFPVGGGGGESPAYSPTSPQYEPREYYGYTSPQYSPPNTP